MNLLHTQSRGYFMFIWYDTIKKLVYMFSHRRHKAAYVCSMSINCFSFLPYQIYLSVHFAHYVLFCYLNKAS